MRNNRYEIDLLYICPFMCLDNINIVPDLGYPPRLCVVDKVNKIAIDIENRLKYNYIDRVRRLKANDIKDKIADDKRVAIPALYCLNTTEIFYDQCLEIVKNLEKGMYFKDGNTELNNEEYLKSVTENKKVKKLGGFKKGKK